MWIITIFFDKISGRKFLPFNASSTEFISAARKSKAKRQTWTAKKSRYCILFVRFLPPIPIPMSLNHIICSCWPCWYCRHCLDWHFDNLKIKNRDFTVLRYMEVVTDPEAISWISTTSLIKLKSIYLKLIVSMITVKLKSRIIFLHRVPSG